MKTLRFKLTNKRITKISDILSDMGVVSTASGVFPSIFGNHIDVTILGGGALSILLWTFSLLLLK